MKEVMLDLETLGNNSFASILSIGAVKFDPDVVPDGDDDNAYETFHVYVDPASCAMHGLSMDTGTVMWWLKQDKAAQTMQVEAKRVSLPEALQAFSDWFGKESMPVWGNGATFDNVILSNAYKACGMEQPWKYRDDSCYRTIKNKAPEIALERYGTFHNALHDAMSQARHLQRLNQHLFGKLDLNALQAKLDALMQEYCPEDMTPEQLAVWGQHQQESDVPGEEIVKNLESPCGVDD